MTARMTPEREAEIRGNLEHPGKGRDAVWRAAARDLLAELDAERERAEAAEARAKRAADRVEYLEGEMVRRDAHENGLMRAWSEERAEKVAALDRAEAAEARSEELDDDLCRCMRDRREALDRAEAAMREAGR